MSLPGRDARDARNRPDIFCRSAAGILLAVCLLLCALAPLTARAEGSLDVEDNIPSYNLVPQVYITPDPGGRLALKDMVGRYNTGNRGEPGRGNVIPLGTSATPYWLVFAVNNLSYSDHWVLTFGQHLTGRTGVLKSIFLYDVLNRAKFLDTQNTDNPAVHSDTSGVSYVPITIPHGHQGVFFMYVTPASGAPVTLAPRLMSEAGFAARVTSPVAPTRAMNFFFAGLLGVLLSVVAFNRYWRALIFFAYYALQLVAFNYQSSTLYTGNPHTVAYAAALNAAVAVAGLWGLKIFLGIGRMDRLQERQIVLFIALVAGCAAAAILTGMHGLIFMTLTVLPAIAALFFSFFLSLAQGYTGRQGAFPFAAGWLIAALGGLTGFLDTMNILPPSALLVSAPWYAMVVQSLIIVAAFMQQTGQGEEIVAAPGDDELSAQLRQSRETTENQRLRRLIEHEREVMNELREREMTQSEEMRKAMNAADQANFAKSAFLAVISHEIRTPMTGIMGMVRLMLDTALTREQTDYAQTIQDSGDAMMALLNDILDFEKIESGRMDLEHVDFDLHRVLQSVTTLMTGHATAKKISLTLDLDPRVPRYMVGDPTRLRQVLLNLVGNSIKFTGEGGVTLRVRPEEQGENQASGAYRIQFNVIDTGVGISPEAQKKLFNPFSQADNSVARKFGGTGLGLAISQRLIEGMGGKIRIESTPGDGSNFYFTVAMREGAAEGIGKATSLTPSARPEKAMDILIVEDNEINQKLLKEFIARFGHRTVLAGSGEEALKIVTERGFDMIFMDIELPGMSGMGTTKAIRALPDRSRAGTPIVALTGNVRDEDVRNAYAANMNGYIAKPIDPKLLKAMIDKVGRGTLDNPVILDEEQPRSAMGERTSDLPGEPFSGTPLHEMLQSLGEYSVSDAELEEDSFAEAIDRMPAAAAPPAAAPEARAEFTPEPGSEAADIFDPATLGSLRGGMTMAQIDEMIQSVFATTDEILDKLSHGAVDGATLAARAHELKGMAGNFGLSELYRLSGVLEKAGRGGETVDLQAEVAALRRARSRADAAVRDWLGAPAV